MTQPKHCLLGCSISLELRISHPLWVIDLEFKRPRGRTEGQAKTPKCTYKDLIAIAIHMLEANCMLVENLAVGVYGEDRFGFFGLSKFLTETLLGLASEGTSSIRTKTGMITGCCCL